MRAGEGWLTARDLELARRALGLDKEPVVPTAEERLAAARRSMDALDARVADAVAQMEDALQRLARMEAALERVAAHLEATAVRVRGILQDLRNRP